MYYYLRITCYSVNVTRKTSRQYASDVASRRTTLAVENVTKEGSMDNDAENVIILFSSLLACIKMETSLFSRVFGPQKDFGSKIIHDLIEKPALFVCGVSDSFLSQVENSLKCQDHASILCLLPILSYFQSNDRRFDALYKVCSAELKAKFVAVNSSATALCVKGLEDFIEHVKSDEDRFVPRDGTVHQLTSNALTFLEQLVGWRDGLARVLSDDGQPQPALVPKLFARVLSALGLNLRNKAELYGSASFALGHVAPLKALFLLNNCNHILKLLQRSGIMRLVCQQNREVEGYYHDQLKEHKRQYLVSWAGLAVMVAEYQQKTGMVDGPVSVAQKARLRDRERDLIKATFYDFNKQFEAALAFHASLSLPDAELAAQLRRDVLELILPKYAWFYNNHHSVEFSKTPEKYIRFTPQDIIASIEKIFIH